MRSWPALVVTFAPASPPDARDSVSAALDGLDVVAIDEPSDDVWRVCFRDEGARGVAMDALAGNPAFSVAPLDMPDDDWARRSQAALGAIRVGPIVVAPPWDDAAAHRPEEAITIVIEPGMGFGSGHHATTQLCLAALLRESPAGKTVLDIGTGSGVLAIAAAALGARSVLAVDVDPDALASARTNAALNAHPPALQFQEADFRTRALPRAHIVLANLTGGMLMAAADDVMCCCAAGGTVILSGITAEEGPDVTSAFARRGTVVDSREDAGWLSLVVKP